MKISKPLIASTLALAVAVSAQAEAPMNPIPNHLAPIGAPTPSSQNPIPNQRLSFDRNPNMIPAAPATQAKAYMLMDAQSGRVIATSNPDLRLPPASLTKLMTLYIVSSALKQGRIKLTDDVLISENAWRSGGSRMFVKVGNTVRVEDLIHGIIIASGNDACVALAEHVAGSEDSFADLMNQQARLLGMKNSHFTDSTGMPNANHYTTARDLALLANAIINDFPEHYDWYKMKWFTWNGIRQPNRNRLLWRDDAVDGLKTGHTDEAGYCLVASAKKGDTRFISVVLGEPSDNVRAADSQALLTYGFRNFESRKIFGATKPLNTLRVWMGEEKFIPAGITRDLYATIPAGSSQNLEANIVLGKQLKAPIARGQQIGYIKVTLDGKELGKQPIVALKEVKKGGMWSRIRDTTHLTIKGWLGLTEKDQPASKITT